MNGINFVRERHKKLTEAQQRDKQFVRYGIISLIVCFVIFLVAIGSRLWFARNLRIIQQEQENLVRQIEAARPLEADYTLFVQKLSALTELFGRRKDKQEALAFFSSVFGEEITVSSIEYSEDQDNVLTFTLSIPSVFLLDSVFETLESDQVKEKYTSVAKSNLGRGPSGTYTMQLTVTLIEESQLDKIIEERSSS